MRYLLVDALNCFARAYCVNPAVSSNGDFVGGILGFLKILQKAVKNTKPDRIIVCWDSTSKRKKKMNQSYKEGRRKFSHLNRTIDVLTEEQKRANYEFQRNRLIEYLNALPVAQLWFQDIEADEIIGYLCSSPILRGNQKIILSSDKDFLQLCDKDTLCYNTGKDKFFSIKEVINEYQIHPKNFALAKSICGDPSDNLAGVGGVGFKTLTKHFPFFIENEELTLIDVLKVCSQQAVSSKLKIFKTIQEQEKIIRSNYRIMQLHSVILPPENVETAKEVIENFSPSFQEMVVDKMLLDDTLSGTNFSDLFSACRRIASGL